MLKAITLLVFLVSCSRLVELADDSYYEKVNPKNGADHFKVVFSHNINGETHPCGCRKFPLGGLPQAAGYLYEAAQDSNIIYVDTGDMLFPSTTIPSTLNDSVKFTADKLAKAQEMQGLKYFVPGDQDFALGVNYLAELSKRSKFSFVISNAKKELPLKHKEDVVNKIGDVNLVMLGVVEPSLLKPEDSKLFHDAQSALKKSLKAIAELKLDKDKTKIILLSHSGMSRDKLLAKKFPEIDWIIGSHSQAYLKEPETVGDVKIVQALSRNHYMGEIKIPFNKKKDGSYKLVGIAEDFEKKKPENPMIAWLAKYKSELEAVQAAEQKRLMANASDSDLKTPTYISCSECHTKQTEFWQTTAHSLAWQTLEKAQAANNSQCIECHSLGFGKPEGFPSTEAIVQGPQLSDERMDQYWEEVNKVFKDVHSIRETSPSKRSELAKKWKKIDKNHAVESNFANVQCMHCHNQHPEHPFQMEDKVVQKDYSNNCIKCHTADQSPEWYLKGSNGLATTLNKKYVDQKIKELSCPKM
ncbi:MAG: hypothetical protein CME64_11140 [Halobacteriovoraceae bacterium]|nr:hypothetical protein [Halobacteriovoraceae bacterium]